MDDQTLKKLQTAVSTSRKDLAPYRRQEDEALKQYLGSHYGDDGSSEPFPGNMMEIAVTTLLQQLAAKEPQVLLLSRTEQDTQTVELAINKLLVEMDFGAELRQFVMSALFSIGIMKVGIDSTYSAMIDEEQFFETEVYAQHIPFADWVHDTTARKWTPREVQFSGHMYRVPREWVKTNQSFDEKSRDNLPVSTRTAFDEKDRTHSKSEFVPYADLWDIWIPSESRMVTFADGGTSVLSDRQIERGDDYSPFHLMGFNPVLNRIMPLPPVMNWMDAHDLDNRMFVKLGEQASRQKTVTFAQPQSVDDANRIIKSEDGDTVVVANPQGVREARFGGPDQQILGFAGYMREMTSYVMGNLDSMAGLGAQASTATQEGIIKNSGNARLQAMQGEVLKSVQHIVRDVFWWMWNSPLIEMQVTRPIGNTGLSVEASWPIGFTDEGQEFDYRDQMSVDEFEIDIEPYSLQNKPPSVRLMELRQIWQQDILPLMQAGLVQPDMEKYLRLLSKYGDWPELEQIANLVDTNELMGRGRMPANTTREYIRKNEGSTKTMQGTERSMIAQAMAMGNPGQEG